MSDWASESIAPPVPVQPFAPVTPAQTTEDWSIAKEDWSQPSAGNDWGGAPSENWG